MMAERAPATFEYYVSDLGKILRDAAFKVKRARDSAQGSDKEYEAGRLMAYNEVISLMQEQAKAFGLTLKQVGLSDIDPDNDLI